MATKQFTVPGIDQKKADQVAKRRLQQRLVALIDLELTLKHIHWNVVGAVLHRRARDARSAGRRRPPHGRPDGRAHRHPRVRAQRAARQRGGHRDWDDYKLGRATVPEHLGALDVVYSGVIEEHRQAIDEFDELDPVSQDMLIEQAQDLEQYHWFVRAHLETADGTLATAGAQHTKEAAAKAKAAAKR